MIKRILFFLFFLFFFCCGSAFATVYYASPSGSGDGSSQSTPFQIADFWSVASPGDILYLLDGTYTGSNSMITPGSSVDGTSGSYIEIRALNEGEVLIDGEDARAPVYLGGNSYMRLIGFNVANAGSTRNGRVVSLYSSDHIEVKRVVGWDAYATENSSIFHSSYSSDNLFEDCAGWGTARKIFSNYHDTRTTYRRCFYRWSHYVGLPGVYYSFGLTPCYSSESVLVENCIGTWDEQGNTPGSQVNRSHIMTTDNDGSGTGEVYGSLVYCLNSQTDSDRKGGIHLSMNPGWIGKDLISYGEHAGAATFVLEDASSCSNITSIGGGYNPWQNSAVYVGSINVTNAIVQDSARYGVNDGNDIDYVMFYNNSSGNWQSGTPSNYSVSNPDLVGSCGNILAYNATECRPTVSGQRVGGKIKYRYVDGSLTGTELWPWPMNDRIAEAMVDSGYNNKGGLDGNGGTDLTKTVFELDGGTEPSWNGTATYECNDGIDNDGDGLIDLNDPGCDTSTDDNEENTLANNSTYSSDSGNLDVNHPVEHLWDGSTSNAPEYSTGAGDIASFYVEFDLGELYNLTEARLFGDAGGNWVSETWDLEYKEESGDSYSTAFSGQACLGNQWYIETFDVTGRYVKVTVHGDATYPATQACELQLYGAAGAGDTGAPTRSNGNPSGTIQCTSSVTMSLDTNEQAICKYDTSSGTAYDSMSDTFSSTNSTSHSQSIATSCDTSYTYYVRCKDSSDNKNTDDYTISWTVGAEAPPEIGQVLGLQLDGVSFE